jgi:hypothetical protein
MSTSSNNSSSPVGSIMNEEQVVVKPLPTTAPSELLKSLLAKESDLMERAAKEVVFSKPLVSMDETPIFRRGTINLIQGKQGSHKSRLAELICSFLLSKSEEHQANFLNLKKTDEPVTVVCIDTERNTKEELPVAIQSIKKKAGFKITDHPANFRYTSFKTVPRKQRLLALRAYITEVQSKNSDPLFVLLDVGTDFVSNFNNEEETLEFFDYLNMLCEEYECTFLITIHQNPGTDKARGHFGTEGTNKASGIIQIGFVDGNEELIRLKFLKLRTAKRHKPMYLFFDEDLHGLALATDDHIKKNTAERKKVADIVLVVEKLEELLKPSMLQRDLLKVLTSSFDCSENTLKTRLQEIVDQQVEIINEQGQPCTLQIKTANGKPTVYELQEIE